MSATFKTNTKTKTHTKTNTKTKRGENLLEESLHVEAYLLCGALHLKIIRHMILPYTMTKTKTKTKTGKKTKVLKEHNMCYIFEKQRVQGYQI